MTEPITDLARVGVALEATYQLEAMLDMLKHTDGQEGWDYMIRASLPRLKELTSVVLSVVGDDSGRTVADMKEVLHG